MCEAEMSPTRILDGHAELLATYRELIADIGPSSSALEEAALLAVVAFLRQGVRPFARLEEHALSPSSAARESAAFEHAFVAAETERLGREIRALLDTLRRPGGDAVSELETVRRRLHRIEAVLEIHTLKERDLAGGEPP